MATSSLTIRIDEDVKRRTRELFARLGMDMTTAVNVFFRQTLETGGMLFDVRLRQKGK